MKLFGRHNLQSSVDPRAALGDNVEMRSTSSGNRSLEPGGCDDNMVCGLEVCDELDECNAYRNDCEGDYTDKMTGATLLREDVAKARAEEMAWYDKFEAHEEVTDETCLSRTGRKPISCRWKDINKGGNEHVEVRSRLIGREIKQNGAVERNTSHTFFLMHLAHVITLTSWLKVSQVRMRSIYMSSMMSHV